MASGPRSIRCLKRDPPLRPLRPHTQFSQPTRSADQYPVAVGTPVTRRPPHVSVREALPHTALAADTSVEASRPAHTGLLKYRRDPALCPAAANCPVSLLGRWPSLHVLRWRSPTRPCSGTSSVLRHRPTPQPRACWPYGTRPSPTGPPLAGDGRCWGLPVLAPGVSTHAWGLRLRRVRSPR